MTVVSNASPLINLSRVRQLDLLHDVFGEILIPPAVRHEVVQRGQGKPGASEVAAAGWIRVQVPSDQRTLGELCGVLGRGEAEAIVLASEVHAERLLIDELQGRGSHGTAAYAWLGHWGS